MSDANSSPLHQRVLVLAPTPRDASLCREILGGAGLPASMCEDVPEICRQIRRGAAAAVLTEESLAPAAIMHLLDVLSGQPAWSDLPILVLTQEGAASETALRVLETLGNVTLLERPVRVPTLVSAVRTALRARARQYQLRELLQEADRTAERLREEAKRKDEFLAMLAHELRNPLAPIRNGVAILNLDASAGEQSREVLSMMERQVGQMVRLVDDLLDVSRILRGKIPLQREVLHLPALIKQAAETAQPLIEAQQHELTLSFASGPLHVKGDAVRLAQVFANLLNNAAKYTDAGGRIAVRVERTDEQTISTTVSDNGVGISAEMVPRVFDLFSQAERSLDRSLGGLGLGLTLVRRLVEMHGGSVDVFSAGLGHGSEFRVDLPAHQPAVQAKHAPPVGAGPSGSPVRHRILVIDDNRDAADTLAHLLRKSGNEVRSTYEGHTALEEIDRFRPDVVLLDIGLPGMSGYEVARRIRLSGPAMLLIAVTGYGQEEDRRLAAAAGFDHHLVKPIDLALLSQILQSRRESDAGLHPEPAARR